MSVLNTDGTCSKPRISTDPLVWLHSGHDRLVELESGRQGGRRVYDGHAGKQHLPCGRITRVQHDKDSTVTISKAHNA